LFPLKNVKEKLVQNCVIPLFPPPSSSSAVDDYYQDRTLSNFWALIIAFVFGLFKQRLKKFPVVARFPALFTGRRRKRGENPIPGITGKY